MTDDLPARRLGAAEVDTILRRAARADAVVRPPAPFDPTLPDLMEAAREAGLDPGEVRRAAALEPPTAGGPATLAFGAPDRREVRAFLDGTELPKDRQALVRAIERALRRRGEVDVSDPGSFVWKEDHTFGRTSVTLTQESGGVALTVHADRAGHYLTAWFGGVLGWAGLSWLVPLSWGGPPGMVLSFVLLPILIARPFWTRSDRAARERLEDAAMELLRVVDEEGPDGEAARAELPSGA